MIDKVKVQYVGVEIDTEKDSDGDGIPDYMDDDDDNDGIPDHLDEDDNGNGIPDFMEIVRIMICFIRFFLLSL